jgi:tetratricopeptide (TPR) repeat protein
MGWLLWAWAAWAANPEARAKKADERAQAARAAYEQGDDEGAVANAEKALRLAPEHVEAHFFLAEALARRCSGQPCPEAEVDRMFTSFELVARQDPTGVLGGLARGVLAALRPPPGGAPLTYVGPPCPPEAEAAFEQAEAAFAEARLEVALERYTEAARACPAHPTYEVWRGDALYGLRRYDEAVAAYTHALELEPCYWVAHRFPRRHPAGER